MRFTVKRPNENILTLARKLGYTPVVSDSVGENSFTRFLGRGDYPRFHIYAKENQKEGTIAINLHLDQKKPSYKGSPAHSGEYEGELVEREMERIMKITLIEKQ